MTALLHPAAVTYTRADEPGTSPKAAGFMAEAETAGGEWSCPSRPRGPAEQPIGKVRWSRVLDARPFATPRWPTADDPDALPLFSVPHPSPASPEASGDAPRASAGGHGVAR